MRTITKTHGQTNIMTTKRERQSDEQDKPETQSHDKQKDKHAGKRT